MMNGHAAGAQRGFDGGIARQGGGVVVVVEEDGAGAGFVRQARHFLARDAVPHDQPAPRRGERLLQFGDARVNEFDAAIGRVRQRIENLAVEHKSAYHLPGLPERMVERGMVEIAQVAAEPDQRTVVFRHGAGRPLYVNETDCGMYAGSRRITMEGPSWIP